MLFRKLLRTMWLYKANFLSMIIMVTLGIGIYVGFQIEWKTMEVQTEAFYEETGFADYRIFEPEGITPAVRDAFSEETQIEAASRFFSANAEVIGEKGDALSLAVTENEAVSGMMETEGAPYDSESVDGIWLSDQYAHRNQISVGDTLSLSLQGKTFEANVKGLVKSSEYTICTRDISQLMPDFDTFGFAYLSPAFYENLTGTDYYPALYLKTDASKQEISTMAHTIFGKNMQLITGEDQTSYAGPQGEIEEGKTMAGLLPPIFLLIAVLTMVTTMHRIVVKEKTQIGTLKALGFKDRRILFHYTSFALTVSLIGCSIGIFAGYQLGHFIDSADGAMGTYLDLPSWKPALPGETLPVLAAMVLFMTLVGYLSTRKMLSGTAAEIFRTDTARNIKPLALEEHAWFHRLSFADRWNLRDSLQHKTRTFISIFGVMSCMMILVAILGMQDSMDHYVDSYYDGTMDYETRIYLADNVDPSQRQALIRNYDGDASAQIGCDLNGETVLAEIHENNQNYVKFLNTDDEAISLSDDGAYLCLRIAEKQNLSVGDTFTVKPFGSDEAYILKVAGLIRSFSEGIYLSDTYAEQVGLPYLADSIYTKTLKQDIPGTEEILSVQSKKMIISSFDSFMTIMNTMVFIFIAVGITLAVVVLYNLGSMMYTERYRELATLKVLGFKDRKISSILHSQTLWSTLCGMLFGIPLGVWMLTYIIDTLAAEYEMVVHIDPSSYLISILITCGVSLLVSVMTAHKCKKIDMVSSLKGAE